MNSIIAIEFTSAGRAPASQTATNREKDDFLFVVSVSNTKTPQHIAVNGCWAGRNAAIAFCMYYYRTRTGRFVWMRQSAAQDQTDTIIYNTIHRLRQNVQLYDVVARIENDNSQKYNCTHWLVVEGIICLEVTGGFGLSTKMVLLLPDDDGDDYLQMGDMIIR